MLKNRLHALAFVIASVAFSLIVQDAHTQQPSFSLSWTANLNTLLESAPTLADINDDGLEEILVAGREELIALEGSGKELWRWRTPGRFMTYPTTLIREKGRRSLIYVADTTGAFSCIDGTGQLAWQAKMNAPSSWSAAVVYDVNGDGAPETIQTDESGAVWAFSADSGNVVWQASVKGVPVSPAIGPSCAEGAPLIAVTTGAGMLTALKGDGTILWQRGIGGSSQSWATSAPVIFRASDGTARIAAAASEGRLSCFNAEGVLLWSQATRGTLASTISVGDLDLDGSPEVFCITQKGVIYRFEEDGRLLWEIDMQGRCLAAGSILDLTGDGTMQYAFCTQSGRFVVLNDKGEPIYEHVFDNRTINMTPTFGHVSASVPNTEMIVTGGESGRVFCFATHAPLNAKKQWSQYRGPNLANCYWPAPEEAAAARMTPLNLAENLLATGDAVHFAVRKDGSLRICKATAACVRPDGSRQSAVIPIVSANTELQLPVELSLPGAYAFDWQLTDNNGSVLSQGKRCISVQPFANDRAMVERAIAALTSSGETIRDTLPLTHAALSREAAALRAEAENLEQLRRSFAATEANEEESATGKAAALVAHARRCAQIAEIAKQASALGSGTSILAFEDVIWDSRNVSQRLPDRIVNPFLIERRVVQCEHEPVSLKLFNITDRELQVRAILETAEDGPTVNLHYSECVPTGQGEQSWDPLPELSSACIVTIPSLAARELWLDVEIGNMKPGRHNVKLSLQALNGAGVMEAGSNPHDVACPETTVELALNVLPFDMASPGSLRLCAWATLGPAEIADMLAHGNNVFCTPSPELKFDESGRLSGCDYAKLDAVMKPLRGNDVVLLVQGMPALHGKIGEANYGADLKRFLDDLAQHMADAGFDTSKFALYPIDEPGGAGWNAVNQLVAFGKAVRAARPDIQIYMDGGGELPMFEAMAPVIDIWTPGINMLAEDSPEMKVVRGTGKQLWSYNCSYSFSMASRSSLKNTNIVAEYRTAALFAIRHNATGIGFWSYNIGSDPWTRIELDYPLVYPGQGKPVTSRRWEAVREGIEDARIVMALRERAGVIEDGAVAARVKSLLESALPSLVDTSFKEMTLGLGRCAIDISSSDVTMGRFRKELLDCVEAVAGANPR